MHPMWQRRGFRGLGQTYSTVSTPSGDYQIVSAADGSQTIFDPSGNVVPSIPSGTAPPGFAGPLQGSQTYSGNVAISTNSLASMFPGMTGTTNIFGTSVPSWLVPVGLILSALVLYKGFTK
jgi:hypothetical protein